jgi:hypothetical protein
VASGGQLTAKEQSPRVGRVGGGAGATAKGGPVERKDGTRGICAARASGGCVWSSGFFCTNFWSRVVEGKAQWAV